MAAMTGAPMPKDEGDKEFLDIVLFHLKEFELSDAAFSLLEQRISDAYREAITSDEARLLEFRANCERLGATIVDMQISDSIHTHIEYEIIEKSFLRLCPGFYPFC